MNVKMPKVDDDDILCFTVKCPHCGHEWNSRNAFDECPNCKEKKSLPEERDIATSDLPYFYTEDYP